MPHTRRNALAALGALAASPFMNSLKAASPFSSGDEPIIATNTYPWLTFARRNSHEFHIHSDKLLEQIAATGLNGYEPIIDAAAEFQELGPRLKSHGLQMRSIYVNSSLHEESAVGRSIADVLAIADAGSQLGVKIIVTNPSPIKWGSPENKNDAQLRRQAKSLDRLGAELRKCGITLAYHNHEAELREGGREFHHMLTATDPDNVKFCLDAHWVFRGCGNSEVAVFDALTHYHDRIAELHLHQSVGGVWTEAFAMQGDIDYQRLMRFLASKDIMPHLVLEQAVEAKTPNEMSVVEAHRQGCDAVLKSRRI